MSYVGIGHPELLVLMLAVLGLVVWGSIRLLRRSHRPPPTSSAPPPPPPPPPPLA